MLGVELSEDLKVRQRSDYILRFFGCLKSLIICFIILIVGFYIGYHNDGVQKRFFYPLEYQDLVFKYASQHSVSPFLVAAVIKNESKFNAKALSPKGAVGLMQIMPETASWIAKQLKINDFTTAYLSDPETNIKFGTWYLSELIDEFEGNEVLVLAAYNAGRGNVKEWMRKAEWDFKFSDVEAIPFKETREYIKKVQYDKQRYQELYGR